MVMGILRRVFALLVIALVLLASPAEAWKKGIPSSPNGPFSISPSGSDSNPCSLALPCQTVAHVQGVVQARAPAMTQDINVFWRAGIYPPPAGATWALTSADSGHNGHKVNWQGYPGEAVTFSGGTTITGWTLFSGSIFRANVGTSVDFRQLYVNGVHATRARGALNPGGWSTTSTGYTAPDTTVAGYGNLTNVEIVSIGDWAMNRCLIASAVGTAITMQTPCYTIVNSVRSVFHWNTVAWVENAFELMASGSWYLDKSAGFLYYWPPGGTMSGLTVVAPTVEGLVSVTGADRITFSNITWSHSNWLYPNNGGNGYPAVIAGWYMDNPANLNHAAAMGAAFSIVGSTNIDIISGEFSHNGGGGVNIQGASGTVNVKQTRFTDNAGLGVSTGDATTGTCPSTAETNVTIQNNLFATAPFMYTDAVASVGACSVNLVVDHNEIDSPPAFGVYFGWTPIGTAYNANAAVTNNLIFAPCNVYIDCGGVYAESLQSQSGTFPTGLQVNGNYINGNGTFAGFGCLYADQGSTWETWTNNVCVSPKFIHIPFSSVTNVSMTLNFDDGGTIVNLGGANVTVSPNTSNVTDPGALAVIANAGVQSGVVVGPH